MATAVVDSGRMRQIKSVASGPVIMIGVTASMGGFLFGADTGQISGFLIMQDYLKRFAEHSDEKTQGVPYKFSNAREGLIVGLLSIGCLFGSWIAAPISNRLGRRGCMIAFCCVFYVGNTIQVTAFHAWYQIAIGRFVCGLAVGALSVLVPIYVSETVPKQIRGAFVAMYQLFITLGILVSYLINLGTSHVADRSSASWRVPIAIAYVWSALLMIGMMILPETPRYLISKGRKDQAVKALKFIAGKKNRDDKEFIDAQYQEMEANVNAVRQTSKATLFSAFNPKDKVLYRTILGFCLQMLQQLTGANYFFYYGASLFQSVGISNGFVTQIILGVVNSICTLPGLWFVERFGRRKPLIIGGLWQAAWLLVFAALGSEKDPNDKKIGSVLIFAACMFIAGFASTWGPGVWVAIGELYPLRVRSHCASIATGGNWSWNFLLTFFTPFITSSIGYRYGYVFAGCNLVGALMVYFFYYESSNLALEHVDDMYCDGSIKAWNSNDWVPSGYDSRDDAAKAADDNNVVSAREHERTHSDAESKDEV